MKQIIYVLIGMLVLAGCQVKCPDCICPPQNICEICEDCKVCGEIREEKALLSGVFGGWGENELNSKELIFSITIFNYGYVEAKNVKVTCYVDDKNDKRIFTKSKIVGNIGSTNVAYQEAIFEKTIVKDIGTNMGYCYISGCENCEILDNRIPLLKEVMN